MEEQTRSSRRRSSVFLVNEEQRREFPKEVEAIEYPEEYVQKINDEMNQWKVYTKQAIRETKQCKERIKNIKNAVKEELLNDEQNLFLKSINNCFHQYIEEQQYFVRKMEMLDSEDNKVNESLFKCMEEAEKNVLKKF